ncbi:hypothetical protein Dimus_039793 [Dionaea muscipula]
MSSYTLRDTIAQGKRVAATNQLPPLQIQEVAPNTGLPPLQIRDSVVPGTTAATTGTAATEPQVAGQGVQPTPPRETEPRDDLQDDEVPQDTGNPPPEGEEAPPSREEFRQLTNMFLEGFTQLSEANRQQWATLVVDVTKG